MLCFDLNENDFICESHSMVRVSLDARWSLPSWILILLTLIGEHVLVKPDASLLQKQITKCVMDVLLKISQNILCLSEIIVYHF